MLLVISLRKKYKILISKLVKNCIPNIKKSIKKHKNLIDFLMFGMQFLTNFQVSILYIFFEGIANKMFQFSLTQNGSKKAFFCTSYPWEKSTKYSFQNWSKTAYQTSYHFFIKTIDNTSPRLISFRGGRGIVLFFSLDIEEERV